MVKGISRQVVVVRSLDTNLFDQAIFLIRDGALPREGITQAEIVRQATQAAQQCLQKRKAPPRPARVLGRILWALGGACAVGLLWLLSLL